MPTSTCIETLRDLAHKYLDICNNPQQPTLRDLWRDKNSLRPVRPLIHIRGMAWKEARPSAWSCGDPVLRGVEEQLQRELYRASFGDDTVFEPWLTVQAVYRGADWGVPVERHTSGGAGGSYKIDYALRDLSDIDKLCRPRHEIDEAATAERVAKVAEAVGDILPVHVDRGPALRAFSDIATQLGMFRGIEHFMLDMYDNPEWLHRLAAFLGDGILAVHEQAEAAGDFSLANGINQAMTYSRELPDPDASAAGARRADLWWYLAAQEFTLVSPALHEEFLLRYQLPILQPFGLVSYGCCEDLSAKIDMLRQIPNLRRIAVSPMANVRRCAEQIGRDYVLSYRPSPTDMVGYGWDEDRIRRILRDDFEAMRGTHFDITLKDVETVQGDAGRIRKWVTVTREEIDRAGLA